MSDESRRRVGTTTTNIHIMALDGIVNVNSLFTLALFLGLTWSPTTEPIGGDATCAVDSSVAENLIAFHVYSFSAFLFSSLISLAIKQAIKIFDRNSTDQLHHAAHVNLARFRAGILVSALGSVLGCVFLTVALVDLVEIKLGVLGCGDVHTWAAIVPLVILVPSALLIYVFLVIYAFTR